VKQRLRQAPIVKEAAQWRHLNVLLSIDKPTIVRGIFNEISSRAAKTQIEGSWRGGAPQPLAG
jgi:hypothetical protein